LKRILIVNADDFGRSFGINRGVARAHEHGVVTSASLMVRYPASARAAAYARQRPSLSLGLHVDLGEWSLADGKWQAIYERHPVEQEVESQLQAFRSLVGVDPTHLDSHQHAHRHEPLRSQLVELAAELSVPLRDLNPHVRYLGSFYGQDSQGKPLRSTINVEGLLRLIDELPEGVTELGCHPGDATALVSRYVEERSIEVETLCDPRVRAAIADGQIELCTFPEALSWPA